MTVNTRESLVKIIDIGASVSPRIIIKRIHEHGVPVYFLGANDEFHPASVYLPATLASGSDFVKIPLLKRKYPIGELWGDEAELIAMSKKSVGGGQVTKRRPRTSTAPLRDVAILEAAEKTYRGLTHNSGRLVAENGKPIKKHFALHILRNKTKFSGLTGYTLSKRIIEKALASWEAS